MVSIGRINSRRTAAAVAVTLWKQPVAAVAPPLRAAKAKRKEARQAAVAVALPPQAVKAKKLGARQADAEAAPQPQVAKVKRREANQEDVEAVPPLQIVRARDPHIGVVGIFIRNSDCPLLYLFEACHIN